MTTHTITTGEGLGRVLIEARPGDEIAIGPHRLTQDPATPRPYTGQVAVRANGTAENPILVRALEGAVFSGLWSFESSYVEFNGLLWSSFAGPQHIGRDRSRQDPLRNLVFRDCTWAHGPGAQRAWFAEHMMYERCHWRDNRSRQAGVDANAWALLRYGIDITFLQCLAEDFGSDWIQLMPNSPLCGPAEGIVIDGCQAWINRPYRSQVWHTFADNVGENIFDFKGDQTRGVLVRGGEYGGIRPVIEGQDASGDDGNLVRVHFGARNVRFEQVHFYDAPYGIIVSRGTETGGDVPTGNVRILGCTFEGVPTPVRVGKDAAGNPLDVTVDPNWRPSVPGPDLAALRAQLVAIEAGFTEMEGELESHVDGQRLRIAQMKTILGKTLEGL